MLDQFQYLYKYRIQFSSDTQIGYVTVITVGTKADAINLFLKHCRLQHPVVIDCKFMSVIVDKGGGGGTVGTLTFEVNGEVVGTFDGANKTIGISVPTKMSELQNDSSYITKDDISEELVDEIKQDVERELSTKIELAENKVQEIGEVGSAVEYPSTAAVIKYIDERIMTADDVIKIIEGTYGH